MNPYSTRPTRPASRRRSFDMHFAVIIGIFAVAIFAIGFTGFQAVVVQNSHTSCTVVDKDRTKDRDGKSDMRIYTEGCDGAEKSQVFKVGDNWFAGQFDAANTYADIEIGKTYEFETRGSRIPILSAFENIVGVTELSK